MVVCPQPTAAETARDVLLAGGNAVDAAVAAGLVQGVLDPQMCGLGGGGCMLIHRANGRDEVVEFYPRAARSYERTRWANSVVRVCR
jgi:gamma-glutamyltranspeptidase/glutathione hydrolase